MDTAHRIRQAVAEVELLRRENRATPQLGTMVGAVKRFQARRFAGTYADLLASSAYGTAARFFLDELYSDKDYAERDAQFGRIAGAVETFFPRDVAETAVALAQLHSLTESLDHAMAVVVLRDHGPGEVAPGAYLAAWREVGRRPERDRQMTTVLGIGTEMTRLTRLPGLRLMLKMMRGPASAAGLSSLQRFLETGFDTFSGMSKRARGAETFLAIIRERESRLLGELFDADAVACETELAATLGQAR
jgi:hypothetical protein